MSADAIALDSTNLRPETADFRLSPEELAKGEQAATRYLQSIKSEEARQAAEQALDTLAALISGGICGGVSFPWQQVRGYHAALAFSIAKEAGAPARVEALRCRHDTKRHYQQTPESFDPKIIKKMRITLRHVLEECHQLGFVSEEAARRLANAEPSGKKRPAARPARDRVIDSGEVRALLAACAMDQGAHGARDALMIGLAWRGRLRTVDLINLSLDDLLFDSRRAQAAVRLRAGRGKRSRRLPLSNDELIALEDWLEHRGREKGSLFCSTNRGGQPEIKRMTAAAVRELCEKRASQAGVEPFSPNDLAKSARRPRRSTADASTQPNEGSVLFDGGRESTRQPETTEHIHFPYRVSGHS